MGIRVSCVACGAQFEAPERSAGKSGKCPKCGGPIQVPLASPSGPPAPDVNQFGLAPVASGSPLNDLFSEEELSAPAPLPPAAPRPPVNRGPSTLAAVGRTRTFTMMPTDWFIVACAAFQLMFLCVAWSGALDKGILTAVVLLEFIVGLLVGLVGLAKGYRLYHDDPRVFKINLAMEVVLCLLGGLIPALLIVAYYLVTHPERTAGARALLLFGVIFFFGSWPAMALIGSAKRAENQQAAEVMVLGRLNSNASEVEFRELRRDARHRFIGVFNQQGDSLGQLIYSVPSGEHKVKSLPCVLMAPAGSNLMTGKCWAPGDDQEALQYADAGMAVLVYELPGEIDFESLRTGKVSKNEYAQAARAFWASGGGVRNARYAMRWLEQNAAEVDPARLFAAGHSSAGTVALLVAARDARVKKVAVYAAPYDLESSFGQEERKAAGDIVPEMAAQLSVTNPKAYAAQIEADIFIFHAKGDGNVAYSKSVAAADDLRRLGKSVTMSSVDGGDHFESMINDGVPRAIRWFNGQDASEPPPAHGNSRDDAANSSQEEPPTRPEDSAPVSPIAPTANAVGLPMEPPQPTKPRFIPAREMRPRYTANGAYDFDEALLCLIAGDGQDVAEAMRWDVGKKCPVVGQRWGFRFHMAKSARTVEFTPESLARSGTIGLVILSRSMTERLTSGPNGHWPRPFGLVPPLVILPSRPATKTLADAQSMGLDYLLLFEMRDVSRGMITRYDVARIALYDTAEQKPLWSSPKERASGRHGNGQSGGDSVMDELAAAIDSKCSLKEMPPLKAEHVKTRLDRILSPPATSERRALDLLAEVRYYQARGLLADDDANEAYQRLLDPAAATAMAGFDEGERRHELRRWAAARK